MIANPDGSFCIENLTISPKTCKTCKDGDCTCSNTPKPLQTALEDNRGINYRLEGKALKRYQEWLKTPLMKNLKGSPTIQFTQRDTGMHIRAMWGNFGVDLQGHG